MAKKRTSVPQPRPRPLLARPGAHFACFSDGLCCSDIHALGPLTRSEVKDMKKLAIASVAYNEDAEGMCMAPTNGGSCYFIKDGKCGVHAKYGAEAKPVGCRRFPYGLIATPDGGRVTTEHRCSCRTLGDRPPLDLEDADVSLQDRAGRLEVTMDVEYSVPITHKKDLPWEEYRKLEDELFARLDAGEKAESVLDAPAFPELTESDWPVYAAEYFSMVDGTSGGVALGYFGDAMLHLTAGHTPPDRGRPWAKFFDRAIARTKTPQDPEVMYNDWIADQLWMFRFREWGALDLGRYELATRLAIARKLQEWFEGMGVRPDQATAEALMVVELASGSTEWPRAVEDIDL